MAIDKNKAKAFSGGMQNATTGAKASNFLKTIFNDDEKEAEKLKKRRAEIEAQRVKNNPMERF